MPIPPRTAESWYLPASPAPYRATWDEVEARFVDGPFKAEREQIYAAARIHCDLVAERLGDGIPVWIDGGFTTDKTWAAPHDVDLAFIIPRERITLAYAEPCASLWTLQGVSVASPSVSFERIQPMGGLVDAFPALDSRAHREYWDDKWSTVKGPDGGIVDGARKGYVEVIL